MEKGDSAKDKITEDLEETAPGGAIRVGPDGKPKEDAKTVALKTAGAVVGAITTIVGGVKAGDEETASKSTWKGPADYSEISDPKDVTSNTKPTPGRFER